MSNKPKGVTIHSANKISYVELAYNTFISNIVSWTKGRHGFSKHVGSKCPSVLKQRTSR